MLVSERSETGSPNPRRLHRLSNVTMIEDEIVLTASLDWDIHGQPAHEQYESSRHMAMAIVVASRLAWSTTNRSLARSTFSAIVGC